MWNAGHPNIERNHIKMMNETEIINLLSDLKHRIFPRPFERLAIFGQNLTGVEIGVYKAFHAESLLKRLNLSRLYLVDPYDLYSTYEEGHRHYGVDQDPLVIAKKEAQQRLAQYADRIHWVNQLSLAAANAIPDGLDFVYIDGNHAEDFIRQDIASYYPKIRPGGVIGGHDFYNGYCREHDGVVKAVIEFAAQNQLELQVELPDWWIGKPLNGNPSNP